MDKPVSKPEWQRAVIRLSTVVTVVVVVGLLYWAREVFIPLALAVFFAYVLAPAVVWLQKLKLGRVPSVLIVGGLALVVCGGGFFLVMQQLVGLSGDLVAQKDAIKSKLVSARESMFGTGESQLKKMLEEMEEAISPTSAPAGNVSPPPAEPAVGEAGKKSAAPPPAQTPKPSWANRLQGLVTPAGEAATLLAFSFVLVIFILLAKEDIQDRVLRVASGGKVTSATRATRDAAQRISRYLLAQLAVNSAFGLIMTVVMFAIGVKYALLWGVIAAVMRYVPYLGTWVGVLLPVGFSFATSPGLWQPVTVFAVYIGVELFSNNFVEPRLYGGSMGISELALLLSAAFWAFLWGPIGLILSGPLTTCLLMLGKYHREFRGMYILLGTDPPLAVGTALFQRLAAGNADEAVRVLEPVKDPAAPAAVYDAAVVPALGLVKKAKADGEMDADDEQRVLATAAEVLDELAPATAGGGGDRTRLIVCPAKDEIDGLAATGFASVLSEQWEVVVMPGGALTSELLAEIARLDPRAVVVAGVWPTSGTHLRYLCKRVRAAAPDVYLLVTLWGAEPGPADPLLAAGASAVEFTFGGARTLLAGMRPVFEQAGAVGTVNA